MASGDPAISAPDPASVRHLGRDDISVGEVRAAARNAAAIDVTDSFLVRAGFRGEKLDVDNGEGNLEGSGPGGEAADEVTSTLASIQLQKGKELEPAVGPDLSGVSDSRLPADTALSGWLEKEGEVFTAWRRRFFVLRGNWLSYYKSDRNLSRPKGQIDVKRHRCKTAGADVDAHGRGFLLAPRMGISRTYSLRAPDLQQKDRWMEAIHAASGGGGKASAAAADPQAQPSGDQQRSMDDDVAEGPGANDALPQRFTTAYLNQAQDKKQRSFLAERGAPGVRVSADALMMSGVVSTLNEESDDELERSLNHASPAATAARGQPLRSSTLGAQSAWASARPSDGFEDTQQDSRAPGVAPEPEPTEGDEYVSVLDIVGAPTTPVDEQQAGDEYVDVADLAGAPSPFVFAPAKAEKRGGDLQRSFLQRRTSNPYAKSPASLPAGEEQPYSLTPDLEDIERERLAGASGQTAASNEQAGNS
jgi:PH domain